MQSGSVQAIVSGAITGTPRRRTRHAAIGWKWLAVFIVVTASAGVVGSLASGDPREFYDSLIKPSWAPPAGVFGPVWSALYLLMATAAWLGVRKAGWHDARGFLIVYVAQLFVNALWNPLFFTVRSGAAASIDVLLLWMAVFWSILALYRLHRVAGLMLVPVLAWVTFASALTLEVWALNSFTL